MPATPGIMTLVELDRLPVFSMELTADDDDGTAVPVDVSVYDAIVLRMRRPDGTLIEIDAVIDDAPNGIFHFPWAADDLQAGVSDLEIVFTDADGLDETFPPDAPIKGIVRERV